MGTCIEGPWALVLGQSSLKQREIELEEGSARVSWYETQLLIGQPNGGSPKLFFLKFIR